ncbi:TonB-linked outer membrane protein, SusC/RagA family [Catalinimonas alkaloidigena]|uniref:TonB-linked outer membrane protein, SusC/RagA family n=1 Tax=Catalinimonas alkaloidigena TaxID=1075417 RepID=A0A1G9GE89_9BACT|nr:TonB-dependent receptor [Catalinimonas alkaloidigena]SDK98947.1 TonB-linked outer membrane protein, SusC/RagA family [Catalinimonas alkaloidigena]
MQYSTRQLLGTLGVYLLLHGATPEARAQQLVSLRQPAQESSTASEAARTLPDVLQELKSKYSVHFMFASELSDQKVTIPQPLQGTLDAQLRRITQQTGLLIQRLDDHNYVIYQPLQAPEPLLAQQPATPAPAPLSRQLANQRARRQALARTISGRVIDAAGEGIPGVNIVEKGTSNGTITDVQGSFTLSVSDDATLVFSAVGYNPQEIAVGNQSVINLTLEENVQALSEVVVVGYGTKRKSDLTGAVSQVKQDELSVVAAPNALQAIQGRSSGVSVSNANQPGAQPTIRIRGAGSINAGNDPLIVVDGFPLVNGNLNDLNSNDIESIEILKDASATAIYGSRGANGVVMVTTKKGSSGQNNLTFSSYYGVQSPARLVKMLNRDEFIDFVNAAYLNQNGAPVYTPDSPAPNYDTDWQDAIIMNSSPMQDYTVTFDGGNQTTRYMLSGGYFSQKGLLDASGFERFTLRTNLEHQFTDWLTVGTHLQGNRSIRNINEGSPSNIFRFGWPTMPVRNPDGSYYFAADDPQHAGFVEGLWNPVADANEKVERNATNRVLGDVYAQFKFLKNFTFRTNLGADLSDGKDFYYASSLHSAGRSSSGVGSQGYNQAQTLINENVLTYDNQWNDHRLTVNGVYSYQQYTYQNLSIGGSGFPTDLTEVNNIALATNLTQPVSDKYSSKLMSWTSRASYAFRDKYLVTLTGRYDGSSRFGAQNKWGFFPSVGLGWRIIEENFLKNSNVLSNLKLRTSYGVTGNQEIGNYQSLSRLSETYYVFNDQLLLGFLESLGNPNLKWERTAQLDVGLDVGILNNRLDFSVDYYKRNTTDLLYNVPIPTNSGYRSMLQNVGEVENTGVELGLNARVIEGAFTWDVSGNLTRNRNRVVELYGDVDRIKLSEEQGLAQYLIVGQPVNGLWARESGGIIRTEAEADALKSIQPFAQPGGERYVDQNGDGAINEDDYVLIGTTAPNFYYGLSTRFGFKNFRLELYGQGATGIALNDTDYLTYGEYQIQNRNYIPSKYAYDRMWREDNPDGTFPRPGAKEVYLSNRTNGGRNFFLVKNIKLSYDLNPELLNVSWFKKINLYVNAQNYLSHANFRGYNPENGDYRYPLAKTLMFGINASF